MKNGKYAFRFSGYTMRDGQTNAGVVFGATYHLVGVGTMTLRGNKIESGEQSSSITRLIASGATIMNAKFSLKGKYSNPVDGLHHATIRFTQAAELNKPRQVLIGEFDFVDAGSDDRFWMISTKTRNVSERRWADEVISGEAILIR